LLSGILCGETIGSVSSRDSYPFNVDTVAVSQVVMEETNHLDRLKALKNQGYGEIAILLHRTPESIDYRKKLKVE